MPRGRDPSFGVARHASRAIEWECASCGSYNDHDAIECHECGLNPGAPEAEHHND